MGSSLSNSFRFLKSRATSLVILIANLALIKVLRGDTCYSRAYKRVVSGLRHFIGMVDAPESKAAV